MNGAVPLLKFTPSAQDPEVLEAITVQRETLIAELVEDALDLSGGARHRLLIGPRGMGKTHILALVANRVRAAGRDSAVLAWLEEDPWAIGTYEKFLAAIVARVAEERSDAELAETAKRLRAGRDADGLQGEQVLRDALGESRLVLLVENLDEVFRRIGESGQERFRAFLENWQQALIVASAPQLFAGVQMHESPFYGFFAITRLEELSLDSATRLMRQVAELRGDGDLVEFLGTDVARRRLAAIEALAGGHPRIWLLLSGCVSIRAIDELVPLFLEALDDLTPYYQDRLRELGDQQQELVVLMGEAGGALSNSALAERSGIAQNRVATMLKQLSDRGYVRRVELPAELATGDERMSYWELREPLMRLCLDVKQARGEPLRMLVEFLRAWYGPRLLDELATLPSSAQLAAAYAGEAFRALEDDLAAEDLFRGSPSEIRARVELGLSLTPDRPEFAVARAIALVLEGRVEEAREAFATLIEAAEPEPVGSLLGALIWEARDPLRDEVGEELLAQRWSALAEDGTGGPGYPGLAAIALCAFGCHAPALKLFPEALDREPESAGLLGFYGISLDAVGRHEEALEAFTRGVALAPDLAGLHANRGVALRRMDRGAEAVTALRKAVALDPKSGINQLNLGISLILCDRPEDALGAFELATGLNAEQEETKVFGQAVALRWLGRLEEAERAVQEAMSLAGDSPMYLFTLAEIVLSRGDVVGGLAKLREAFAIWKERSDAYGGDPELVCRVLWNASSERVARRELVGEAVAVHKELGAAEELGRALVRSIRWVSEPGTSSETVDAWVEDWVRVGSEVPDLRIPLRMLTTARDWKQDRDRSHLLKLPAEQREILLGLLEESDPLELGTREG